MIPLLLHMAKGQALSTTTEFIISLATRLVSLTTTTATTTTTMVAWIAAVVNAWWREWCVLSWVVLTSFNPGVTFSLTKPEIPYLFHFLSRLFFLSLWLEAHHTRSYGPLNAGGFSPNCVFLLVKCIVFLCQNQDWLFYPIQNLHSHVLPPFEGQSSLTLFMRQRQHALDVHYRSYNKLFLSRVWLAFWALDPKDLD